jgi:hypothetical protein
VRVTRTAPVRNPQPRRAAAAVARRARTKQQQGRSRAWRKKESARALRRQLPRYDKIYEDGSGGLGGKSFPYALPSTVAEANFRGYAKRLWPKVRRHYGLPKGSSMPPLRVHRDSSGTDKMKLAFVMRGSPTVNVTSGVTLANSRKTNPKDKPARDYARGVLIHEWAHTRQKGKHKRSKADVEGGAEAFEQEIRRKLGLPLATSAAYKPFVKKVRRKGRKYVLDTQFKGDR